MTAAFQGNAFQPNAFQMGSDAAPTGLAVVEISDGNDAVMILHEQDQHTDHLGTSSQPPPADDFSECVYPSIKSITTGEDATSSTSHSITLPSFSAGDRILIFDSHGGGTLTSLITTTGWTRSIAQNRLGLHWKNMDGTEGSTVTLTLTSANPVAWVIYVIGAGSYSPSNAPAVANFSAGVGTNPNPPNLSPPWAADKALWIAAISPTGATVGVTSYPYPEGIGYSTSAAESNCATCVKFSENSSEDPGSFSIDTSANTQTATVAILGSCAPVSLYGAGLDTQDFTDEADYSFVSAPLSEDFAPAGEDFLLGTGDGLDTQDFTDEADYGDSVEPAIPDNNPDVAPSSLDDQDFTDTADYGSVAPQAIPDNNPEIAPSSLDDQDFTDTADYGGFAAPAIDDNNPEIAPSSLDDQDFTDFTDYSDYVLQLSDNFVLREDFILGDGQGLDTQDFTDEADYGDFVEPLSNDSVDFLLGTGDGLDFQDFTDTEDYSYTLAPLSDNNNPEVAPSSLDDQDFTDLEDYGSTTPQAVPDNNPQVCVAAVALDDQDFTDTADYGLLVTPLSDDNNPEISVAAVALDDQDFTDLEDYGSFTPQANDDFIAPEDFILGDGQGLDTQDFTDTGDYGYVAWLTPESVTEVYVNGVLITVSIGCFHIDAWQVISDPSTSWSGIAEPSTLWNGIPDVSTVWSTPSDGTTDWTEIPNPSTSWTEEC